MKDAPHGERRREEKVWRDQGRSLFDEGLLDAGEKFERFEARHAVFAAVLLVLGTLLAEFPELWIGVVFRLAGLRP
jgi:hypothetical protein